MDSMFEEPSSPSLVMPAEVAEAEGLVIKPKPLHHQQMGTNRVQQRPSSTTHHGENSVFYYCASVCICACSHIICSAGEAKKQNSLISSVSGLDSDSLGGFAD